MTILPTALAIFAGTFGGLALFGLWTLVSDLFGLSARSKSPLPGREPPPFDLE